MLKKYSPSQRKLFPKRYSCDNEKQNLSELKQKNHDLVTEVFYINKISLMTVKQKLSQSNEKNLMNEIFMELHAILENMHKVFVSLDLEEIYHQIMEVTSSMSKILVFYRESLMKEVEKNDDSKKQTKINIKGSPEKSKSKKKRQRQRKDGKYQISSQNQKSRKSSHLGGIFIYNENYERNMQCRCDEINKEKTKKSEQLVKQVMMKNREERDELNIEDVYNRQQMDYYLLKRRNMKIDVFVSHKKEYLEIQSYLNDLRKKINDMLSGLLSNIQLDLLENMEETKNSAIDKLIEDGLMLNEQRVEKLNQIHSKSNSCIREQIRQILQIKEQFMKKNKETKDFSLQTQEEKIDVYQLKNTLIKVQQERNGFEKLYSESIKRQKDIFKQLEVEVAEKEKQITHKDEQIWKQSQQIMYIKQKSEFYQQIMGLKNKNITKSFELLSQEAKKFFVKELIKNGLIKHDPNTGKGEKKSIVIDKIKGRDSILEVGKNFRPSLAYNFSNNNKKSDSQTSSQNQNENQHQLQKAMFQKKGKKRKISIDEESSKRTSTFSKQLSKDNEGNQKYKNKKQSHFAAESYVEESSEVENKSQNQDQCVNPGNKLSLYPEKKKTFKNIVNTVSSKSKLSRANSDIKFSQNSRDKFMSFKRNSLEKNIVNPLIPKTLNTDQIRQKYQNKESRGQQYINSKEQVGAKLNIDTNKLENYLSELKLSKNNKKTDDQKERGQKDIINSDAIEQSKKEVNESHRKSQLKIRQSQIDCDRYDGNAYEKYQKKKAYVAGIKDQNSEETKKVLRKSRKQFGRFTDSKESSEGNENYHPFNKATDQRFKSLNSSIHEKNEKSKEVKEKMKSALINIRKLSSASMKKQPQYEYLIKQMIDQSKTKHQFVQRFMEEHRKTCKDNNCNHLQQYMRLFEKLKSQQRPALKLPIQNFST